MFSHVITRSTQRYTEMINDYYLTCCSNAVPMASNLMILEVTASPSRT